MTLYSAYSVCNSLWRELILVLFSWLMYQLSYALEQLQIAINYVLNTCLAHLRVEVGHFQHLLNCVVSYSYSYSLLYEKHKAVKLALLLGSVCN